MRARRRERVAIRPARSIRRAPTLAALLLAANLAACSSNVEEQQPQPPHPATQAIIKAPEQSFDRDQIRVQTGDLTLPYDQLGELDYSEPFSPRAIDDDYIDERLRTMATQRWGQQVDAVIEVKTALSADATEVSVIARVVKVRGDCSFCRHQGGNPPSQ